MLFFFCFKQKTAYEIRPCDWSSDVCSSDLIHTVARNTAGDCLVRPWTDNGFLHQRSEERRVGKECTVLCRSRWWPYHLKKKKKKPEKRQHRGWKFGCLLHTY